MPIAVVALDFEPFLRLGDRLVRLEALALAGAILAALVIAARLASRTPAGDAGEPWDRSERLRPDDMLFIALAALPGALVGGRVGYVLIHLGYYAAQPAAILDPRQGSLQLGLAIVGGALTGGLAARLLGEPVARWLHVAAVPLLVAIAGGKAAMALGGSGQGAPSAAPWATMYLGAGPWGLLAPDVPSHPAQLYEALATLVVIGAVLVLRSQGLARPDGRLFVAALGGWAIGRMLVAATWRDPVALGPLRADQLLSIGIAGACLAVVLVSRSRRPGPAADSPRGSIVGRPAGEEPGETAARSR